jgi:hypothetical protein
MERKTARGQTLAPPPAKGPAKLIEKETFGYDIRPGKTGKELGRARRCGVCPRKIKGKKLS